MKNRAIKFWLLVIAACIAGFFIGKMDTSKNWDDTGVTVAVVVIISFLLGYIMKQFAWLWALIIGGFVFSFDVFVNSNYGAAGAILFAFAGAYGGVIFRRMIFGS
jgi:hypothetical protein